MSERRRRKSSRRKLGAGLAPTGIAEALDDIRTHPGRAGLVAVVCIGLVALIATTTLPMALVAHESLALRLSPDNPFALQVKAEKLRARLMTLTGGPLLDSRPALQGTASGKLAIPYDIPEEVAEEDEDVKARESLRQEIETLARRIIKNDPLNARAYTLLAETTSDTAQIKPLMRAALERSRREVSAVYWLLNDALYRREFAEVIEYAHIALVTKPTFTDLTVSFLGPLADDPEGREHLARYLVSDVANAAYSARKNVLARLHTVVRERDSPFELYKLLKASGSPVSTAEIKPYLDTLIVRRQYDLAYSVWLWHLPEDQLSRLGLLYNPGFERKPSGLPFDWQIGPSQGAVVEFTRAPGSRGQQLNVAFGVGRVRMGEVSQLVILAPGRYRFSGRVRGELQGARGLRWQAVCLNQRATLIGQTDMFIGRVPEWLDFEAELKVPDGDDCPIQKIRLVHDSRSSSEQLVSGRVSYDDLGLARIQE